MTRASSYRVSDLALYIWREFLLDFALHLTVTPLCYGAVVAAE
jgi:hypothetical protein